MLMGIGAVFGALNTMYTAVAARTREIATLRALGFGARRGRGLGAGRVAAAGAASAALLGAVGAWAFFDGYHTSTLNWESFSQVTFAFDVTPQLMVHGALFALLLGLLGGLLPAIRAARLPVTAALREA